MKLKLQAGSILKKHGAWHWRYYSGGKQKSVKLADVCDQFRSKQDVIPLANDMATKMPSADSPRTGNLTVVEFTESVYLPWVRDQKRPATYNGVRILWTGRLVPSVNGYVLENSAGNPLELGQFSMRVIRPTLQRLGLEWKGYHAGRRGAETAMARHVNGDPQLVADHFGHSIQVAMAHYLKGVPEETRRAALALDGQLSEGQQGTDKP